MAIVRRNCDSVLPTFINPAILDSPIGRPTSPLWAVLPRLSQSPPPESVDVTVVGGGILGVMVYSWLARHASTRFVIIDSQLELGDRFFRRAAHIGQRTMRSTYGHQIAPDGLLQLLEFARLSYACLNEPEREQLLLGIKGERSVVPLDVFRAHFAFTVSSLGLESRSHHCRVETIERCEGGWCVNTDRGRVISRRVVLACGQRRRRIEAVWERALADESAPVHWVFDAAPPQDRNELLAVVGSGLSAATILRDHLLAGGRAIWLMRRAQEIYQCADVAHRYFRYEGQASFGAEDEDGRVRILGKEQRGSIMLDFQPDLEDMEARGRLRVCRSTWVQRIRRRGHSSVELELGDSKRLSVDRVVLATGIEAEAELLPPTVARCALGFPRLNGALEPEGHAGLHVIGTLASLELGPGAGNLEGGRLAIERLAGVLADKSLVAAGFSGTASVE